MNQSMIRPYEMSLWTLQDSFITVLKGINTESQGQLITPKISIKSDGTQELSFSIPMYYRNEIGKLVENPIWYNTKNGNLMTNLRKIKVIFNKGDKEKEGVYEFVIIKVKETHSKGQLTCEVTAEGLAFQELGKTGYKLVLNFDEFLIDSEDSENFIATLQYWAEKVFKDTNWTYSIQMDWSAYDGIIEDKNYENLTETQKESLNSSREEKGLRRMDRVYEEGYVTSWSYDAVTNSLIPIEIKNFQEKARIPEIEKSNRYNITQTLAETFGVFCKYRYYYDNNYHIIGRECIFYNNFFGDDNGKIDINYPYNTNEITREGDSTDVITKLFVVPLDNIGIQNVNANRSGEDYILNFDYLYEIGTISDEQYQEVAKYEATMFDLNTKAKLKSEEKIILEQKINDLDASLAVAKTSLTYAEEQINSTKQKKNALIEGRNGEIFQKTKLNPQQIFLYDEGGTYAVRSLGLEGIDPSTIEIYTEYDKINGIPNNSPRIYFDKEINTTYDKTTKENLEKIHSLKYYTLANNSSEADLSKPITSAVKAYMICTYCPSKKYENIIELYEKRAALDSEKIETISAEIELKNTEIEKIEAQLQEHYADQATARTRFESMMGPALREGSWQAEDCTDSGDKYSVEISIGEEQKDNFIRGFWDSELFDDEECNYEKVSILETIEYFPAINLTNIISSIKPYIGFEFFSIKYEMEINGGKTETYYLSIGSQMKYGFLQKSEKTVLPIIYITETLTPQEISAIQNGKIGYLTYNTENDFTEKTFNELASLEKDYFLSEDELSNYPIAYPRFEIQSENLRDTDEEIRVRINEKNDLSSIDRYEDYYIFYRDFKYYITIKPEVYLKHWGMNNFVINYIISNADLRLYLDSLEVSKTNAYPQVSYEVSVTALDREIIKTIYKDLNRIVGINDTELKFKNVQGYISELNLALESPWEDEIVVQNYKTKFEDLFSRIVASTETMKANTMIYNRAAAAFTSTGILTSEVIQSTLSRVDLNYAFNNGKLTINEKNGIWGISDSGVVAIRGGGIFCATEQDFDGNWIWHTGIVPEGINASLLTAGVIDTNVIRIFAGDNIRFQMNASGLYSFGENEETGDTDFNNYVVQNSEGLFLIKKETKVENNITVTDILRRVEISWDGFILRNNDNDMVFYADSIGNLVLKGEIYADAGVIGGWLIDENFLQSKEEQREVTGQDEEGNDIYGNLQKLRTVGIASNPNKNNEVSDATVYDAFWAGKTTIFDGNGVPIGEETAFKVKSDGEVQANFIHTTHLSADTASIGGVYISDIIYQIEDIKIQPLRGEFFKFESINDTEPYNGSLKFHIITGPFKDTINHNAWMLEKSYDGENWTKPVALSSIPNSQFDLESLTFILNYDIMKFGEGDSQIVRDVVHIKLTTVQNQNTEDEKEVISEILTLYNVYDGMDGVADFVILRASDVAFYLQEDRETFLPETIRVYAELHGRLTEQDGYWTINNDTTQIQNTSFLDISSTDSRFVNGVITLHYHCMIEGVSKKYSISLYQIRNGKDGEPGESLLTVLITSSNGNIFKNGQIATLLTAHLYLGNEEIKKPEILDDLSPELNYVFKWDGPGLTDEEKMEGLWKNTLQIDSEDFSQRAVYSCNVNLTISD